MKLAEGLPVPFAIFHKTEKMLKFIKYHMASIQDIEIFPIISFLLFFTLFITIIVQVVMMRKTTVAEISSLPLNDSTDSEHIS